MKIADIIIGERHRRDMGDLASLAESIRVQGLLQPIGVTMGNELVFGERRLRAVKDILNWSEVDVRIVDVTSLVEAEHDENELREAFRPSEKVAIGRAVEAEIGKRQGQRTDKELPENFPEVGGRETRQVAADKAGFGNETTYRQAKAVVDGGVAELVEKMDAGEVSVSAAAEIASLPKDEQATVVALSDKEIVAKAKQLRDAKAAERKAEQEKNDVSRQDAQETLSAGVKAMNEAKQAAIDAAKSKKNDALPIRLAELEAENEGLKETNSVLEADYTVLLADYKKLSEMEVLFKSGGFEAVIAGKDEEIRVLKEHLYSESEAKASWMRKANFWKQKAKDLGWRDTRFDVRDDDQDELSVVGG
jgi:ParB family chromosome partitioning protein